MKKIDPKARYVLRDSEEVDISFYEFKHDGKILANIEYVDTGIQNKVSYNLDGTYLNAETPHALDLIESLVWTTGIRDKAPRLLRPGNIYRLKSTDLLQFSVLRLGIQISDPVLMQVFSDQAGKEGLFGNTMYPCDGQQAFRQEDPLSLILAHPLCSTWLPGDPLLVPKKTHSGQFEWRNAVFLRYDAENDFIIASSERAPGSWLGPMHSDEIKIYPQDVRLPDSVSILSTTNAWPVSAKKAIHDSITRMRKSWMPASRAEQLIP